MADPIPAIDYVLSWEGGYVDNPRDPGGATNFGLSLRWYQQVVDPQATKKTIEELTRAKAVEIYESKLWSKEQYARIQSQALANYVFDMSVNMGVFNAVQCAQRALWACYGFERPKDDGILGAVTIASLNAPNESLMASMRATRAGYYRALVAKNPTLVIFLNDWLRRSYVCYTLSPKQ